MSRSKRTGRLGSYGYNEGSAWSAMRAGGWFKKMASPTPVSEVKAAVNDSDTCCPVIHVKCETKKVPVFGPLPPSARADAESLKPKSERVCQVSIGSEHLGWKKPSAAKADLVAAKKTVAAKHCVVRTDGSSLGTVKAKSKGKGRSKGKTRGKKR